MKVCDSYSSFSVARVGEPELSLGDGPAAREHERRLEALLLGEGRQRALELLSRAEADRVHGQLQEKGNLSAGL